MTSKIGVASDHGGKELKQLLAEFLKAKGCDVVDYGVAVNSDKSVDYPDYAEVLAKDVAHGKLDKGVLVCGTGIGMSIAANKIAGIRAALVWDEFTARMASAHNDANVLCLGARVINHHRAADFVSLWLETPFEGARHKSRLDKIHQIEKKSHMR
jgi:ribose 5-phosphate isomerase B